MTAAKSPCKMLRIARILASYAASDCRPAQGPKQFPMWNSRHTRHLPAAIPASFSGSAHVRIGYSVRHSSRTVCIDFALGYGPKYSLPSRTTRRVGKTRGNGSRFRTMNG